MWTRQCLARAVAGGIQGRCPLRGRLSAAAMVLALGMGVVAMRPAGAAPLLETHADALVGSDFETLDDMKINGTAVSLALVINANGSADGQARSWFGVNHAVALVSSNTLAGASATGMSRWRDALTISDPSQAIGAIASATVGVALHGTLINAHPGSRAQIIMDVVYDPDDQTTLGSQSAGVTRRINQDDPVTSPTLLEVDEDVLLTFQYENGVPFDFGVEMEAVVTMATNSSGVVESDFGASAVVTYVDVAPGATLSAASGTAYPVAEPATVVLLGAGGLWLVGPGRRAKRRGRGKAA